MREIISKARTQLNSLNTLVSLKEKQLEELEQSQEVVDKSHRICQSVAKKTQDSLSVQLDSLINLALETCFPNQYEFKTSFIENRGKTELQFVLTDKITGKDNDDIIDGFGGGLIDVVSLALRLCLHTLEGSSKLVVLDEPFKFLSQDLRSKAANLIQELSHKLDLQFIIITHIPEIADVGDRLFEVKKIDGISNTTVVR